jgi:alpha-glucosidase
LDGEIGDYVVTARKDKYSDDWYVGGITDGERREVEVSLNFLDADRTYQATLYRDGNKAGWDTNPTDYIIEQADVTSADTLNIVMAPGGGFAISLKAE